MSEADAPAKTPTRVVHCGDGLAWLDAATQDGTMKGASIITSLPDISELPTLGEVGWVSFFEDAALRCAKAVDDDALCIFFQSDVKPDGVWIDKGALVTHAATSAGLRIVFHKIVLRVPAGTVTHGRAGYSHLIAFSKKAVIDMSRPGPDVIASAGAKTWTRGMGLHACEAACDAVLRMTPTRTIVDPFCGHGTVLAVANERGLHAIGVELGGKRARRARALTFAALTGGDAESDDERKEEESA